jgi:hypothetical protein
MLQQHYSPSWNLICGENNKISSVCYNIQVAYAAKTLFLKPETHLQWGHKINSIYCNFTCSIYCNIIPPTGISSTTGTSSQAEISSTVETTKLAATTSK